MRNVSVVAIVALVGVLGFSAHAQAQANDLTDVAGWWSSLNCRYMIGAAVHSGVDTDAAFTAGTDGDSADEVRWCKMSFDDLALTDRAALNTAVTNGGTDGADRITRKTSQEIISAKGWWNDLSANAQDLAIGGVNGITDGDAISAAVMFDALTVAQHGRVMSSYNGLLKGATATPEPTPALPLVGLGVLGLLLAGRGAYLRRRRA